MSGKRFDFSVLPDGFLIETQEVNHPITSDLVWGIFKMNVYFRHETKYPYRPCLNHWHFNDGSMVLPDGLVFKSFHNKDAIYWVEDGYTVTNSFKLKRYSTELSGHRGIKIIGAHPNYASHAKELGMEVINEI